MDIITQTEYKKLLENGKPGNHGKDHKPVLKLFVRGIGASLVLTELRSKKPLMAYGLLDLAADSCKLSHFDLEKFSEIASQNGAKIERAENFNPRSPISVYESAAKRRRTVSLMRGVLSQEPIVS